MERKDDLVYLWNKAARHVSKQGEPSVLDYDMCVYKGRNGLGCAASPFITEYDEEMEQLQFAEVVARFKDQLDPIAARHPLFVGALQHCHDSSAVTYEVEGQEAFLYEWRNKMRLVAQAAEISDDINTSELYADYPVQ